MEGLGNPIGPPLRRVGPLGDLLGRDLGVGEQASVLGNQPHPGSIGVPHLDATLYQKFPDGKVYPVDKAHVHPRTLKEIG